MFSLPKKLEQHFGHFRMTLKDFVRIEINVKLDKFDNISALVACH